jgi:2-(1,2-epoxy-1,2-dihydrophenyl)acetyl-CoA isomerase
MSYETLRLDRAPNGVVTLILDRPERKNAINMPMFGELRDALREIEHAPEDRVLIVTGAGDAFCSGADISSGGDGKTAVLTVIRQIHEAVTALHQLSKPVIAKLNGVAAGAGLNLALACDLIVASERASLSEIFARRGLSIDFGGSWILPRLVGLHKAKELVLLAEMLSAQEAERIGLVNRVVAHEELDAFVESWAARMAAGPPLALSMSKRLLNAGASSSLLDALENEGMAVAVNNSTEDMREAFRAFREKRDAVFKGR